MLMGFYPCPSTKRPLRGLPLIGRASIGHPSGGVNVCASSISKWMGAHISLACPLANLILHNNLRHTAYWTLNYKLCGATAMHHSGNVKKEGRGSSNIDLPAPPHFVICVDLSVESTLGSDYYLWIVDRLDVACAVPLILEGRGVSLHHFCDHSNDQPAN